MSTDYEPGTVAIATVRGVKGVRVVRVDHTSTPEWMTVGVHPEGKIWHADVHVTDIRPLVVLDLNAIEVPEVIVRHLRGQCGAPAHRNVCPWLSALADQIEAQTKPPHIPEPGLWGVVEARHPIDSTRVTWVHGRTNAEGNDWFSANGDWCRIWSDLIDPTLIREGLS